MGVTRLQSWRLTHAEYTIGAMVKAASGTALGSRKNATVPA
jgi:hypothetical protein